MGLHSPVVYPPGNGIKKEPVFAKKPTQFILGKLQQISPGADTRLLHFPFCCLANSKKFAHRQPCYKLCSLVGWNNR